jgi:putative PIG3 family NAD(P)H quinone oxidoreductase
VEVEAAGVNHAELLQVRGLYPPPPGESDVPGLECAGRVAGDPRTDAPGTWQPGARVMALLAGGGHATRVAVPAGQLMPLPGNLSYVEGGAIPEAGLTAWTNLVAEGNLQPGETVLVTGATGGVGCFAVQLARELGARVLAAGRDRDRLEMLRELGIEEICLEGAGLPQQVREATGGRGVDLVLDLVSGPHLGGHLAALREKGRLVLVGAVAGPRAEIELSPLLRRRVHLVGSVLRPRPREEKARLVADFMAFALPRLKDRRLRPILHRVFPFDRAPEAYKALAAGGVFGKIVLDMSGER